MKLVELTSKGQFLDATKELCSPDIVSVEAMSMPGVPREMTGMDAVIGKGNWWMENHEVHSCKVEGPLVSLHHFCVRYMMDVTNKPSGNRMQLDELAVYQVKDGKIVREEFFYAM